MKKTILIKEFLKDKKVASVKNSSRFVSNYLCDKINFSGKKVIFEYGPGTGVLTNKLLEKMNKNSMLIVIETNFNLSELLKEVEDHRLVVIHDSVENIDNILKRLKIKEVDYVISGIPFSMLKPKTKNKILELTKNVLSKNGRFFVYQFRKSIEKDLNRYFKVLDKHLEVRNIPPLMIFECGK